MDFLFQNQTQNQIFVQNQISEKKNDRFSQNPTYSFSELPGAILMIFGPEKSTLSRVSVDSKIIRIDPGSSENE